MSSKALTTPAPPSELNYKTFTLTTHYQWNERTVREITCSKPPTHVEAEKKFINSSTAKQPLTSFFLSIAIRVRVITFKGGLSINDCQSTEAVGNRRGNSVMLKLKKGCSVNKMTCYYKSEI